MKTGFWPVRRVLTLPELHQVYGDWRDRVAHRRWHATGQFVVGERLAEERRALRPLPPQPFDFSPSRTVRVPADGHLRYGACFYRAPVELVHQRVELHASCDEVWICWRGQEVVRYTRSYRRPVDPPAAHVSGASTTDAWAAAGRRGAAATGLLHDLPRPRAVAS